MNITVVGMGYVGLSNAILLSRFNNVTVLDIVDEKIAMLNSKKLPIDDDYAQSYLLENDLKIQATSCKSEAYKSADLVLISTPTDYDPVSNKFDTTSVDNAVEDIVNQKNNAIIVIKSTVPVGYTDNLRTKHKTENIIFSPEFLREGRALYDNFYPSRIIVGDNSVIAKRYGKIVIECTKKDNVEILHMPSTEAEAVKLFSNTYLAMRVGYFNEIDTFADIHNLDTKSIIDGVSLDPRIGGHYNNPSFGYGGYCLPKDSKQLRANYQNVPSNLIGAIVDSNSTRKDFIASQIMRSNPTLVGVYRLVMKSGSDNFRTSSIQGIMKRLNKAGIEIIVHEPLITKKKFFQSKIVNDIEIFKNDADIIVTNRMHEDLINVAYKVYTRDIFKRD